MTSPPTRHHESGQVAVEHGASEHRFITPAARIFAAIIIMITGSGIATIFWKMPTGTGMHALYDPGIIDQDLALTPLPNESIAVFSLEERRLIALPMLEMTPVADSGANKYLQEETAIEDRQPVAVAVASLNVEQGQFLSPPRMETERIESAPISIPAIIEPIRQIIEDRPILFEPVDRDFPPVPDGVTTSHLILQTNEELQSLFQNTAQLEHFSSLQPLTPLELGELHLYPLPPRGMEDNSQPPVGAPSDVTANP